MTHSFAAARSLEEILTRRFIILTIFLLLTSRLSLAEALPYTEPIPPLSQVPGKGILFTVPDENGWMLFDPDGKGSTIVKQGKSKIESYVISLDYYQQPNPKSENEFKELYEILKQRELAPPRYRGLHADEEFNYSRGKYFLIFYYLIEDHEACHMPLGQKYLLLEVMGFLAVHPDNPDLIVRVAYTYRYSPGHEDHKFKEKAKWVLDQATFAKP
ncbi:MAG: hypothetical protein ACYC9M_14075 [Desulfobulbaceae bacterium]